MAKIVEEEAGNQYGRWTVVRKGGRTAAGKVLWACRCDCGRLAEVAGASLRSGISKSCGCLKAEITSQLRASHRMSEHPAFRAYHAARQRCENSNSPQFDNYGGRNIAFKLPEFSKFWVVMGPSWYRGSSLDRIDNNGDYVLGNIRWATPAMQARNKRSTRMVAAPDGTVRHLLEWAEMLGIHPVALKFRLDNWPLERALTERKQGKGGRPPNVKSLKSTE